MLIIKPVILRYLRGELQGDDQVMLDAWLAESPANGVLLAELENEASVGDVLSYMNTLQQEKAWGVFREYVKRRKAEMADGGSYAVPEEAQGGIHWITDGEHTGRVGRKLWRRVAIAAAVILIVVGAGGYFWWGWKGAGGGNEQSVAAVVTDIAPGGDKAVLTLAGGQQIVLDSAVTGKLALQGSVDVIKMDNGKLVYAAAGSIGEKGVDAGAKVGKVVYNTLSTPRGGQYQLTLSDGTRVWLNAASSITYPTAFTGTERKVVITGEAYLEVAQNVHQPFMVEAAGTQIQVLGTSFNINAYNDEPDIRTTLLEGAVAVKIHGSRQVVRPGQQTVVTPGVNGIDIVENVDVGQVVAWKDGRFAFEQADLYTVMRQLARWYNVDVSFEGNIPPRRFNGRIGKSLTLDQVLKILSHTRIHYSIEADNKLIIRQ